MMRTFLPSAVALLSGVVWLAVTDTLLPATTRTADGACTGASLIARLPDVAEASGLAVSRRHQNLLWTHNDSGQPWLYAVGTDGKLRARVRVTGAELADWEDLSIGRCSAGSCLYIADIGDNKAARARIAVYRVPEPDANDEATAPAEAFYGTYPEGPQDAEGLFVDDNGAIFVVTKGEGSPITLYRFPAGATPGETVQLERVARLAEASDRDDRITDADLSADGKWVALRTLDGVNFYLAGPLLSGAPERPVAVSLSGLGEPQGEAVAFAADGTVYFAGESGDGVHGGTLARASCKLP
jgi:hypothetical protein